MKALVIGIAGNEYHESLVRSYFLSASSSSWTCDIATINGTTGGNIVYAPRSISDAILYAISESYKIVIRSYTSINVYDSLWQLANENNIVVVHAHGSNINNERPYDRFYHAIGVGGGISENVRSYGLGLDVYDATDSELTEESWSTPTVAGMVAHIIENNPSYNVWDVRQHLRQTSNGHGEWDNQNGYGRCELYSSVSGLDQAPVLYFGGSFDVATNKVNLQWTNFKQSGFEFSQILFQNEPIYQGQLEYFSWTPSTTGNIDLFIKSIGNGSTSNSESFTTILISGIIIQPELPNNEEQNEGNQKDIDGFVMPDYNYKQGIPINNNRNYTKERTMGGTGTDKIKYFLRNTWKSEQDREGSQQESIANMSSYMTIVRGEGEFSAKIYVPDPFPYKGTVVLEKGSKTVIGTGTEFTKDWGIFYLAGAYAFCLSGDVSKIYGVDSIISDTEFEISEDWVDQSYTGQIFSPYSYPTSSSGNASFSMGKSTMASGDFSFVAGDLSEAVAESAFCIGESSCASGRFSFACGRGNRAKGLHSFVMGTGSMATGNYSFSQGASCISSGEASHAEGQNTYAIGNYSHSEGRSTTASAVGSHCGGYKCMTQADNSCIASGSGNLIESSAINSSILAGKNMTADLPNTAYAENLLVKSASGIYIYSQNNTRFRLVVNNDGSLTAIAG